MALPDEDTPPPLPPPLSLLEEPVNKDLPIEVLTFRETFNFRTFITNQMLIEDTNEANKTLAASARIVGQECDGTMLLVWDSPRKGPPNEEGTNEIVTHFGVYRPSSPSYRTVYTHESRVHVSGATIDQTCSLLAFTVCEQLPLSSEPSEISYESYVAEINPCNRVFSLNICSSDIRKLQFIQSPSTPSRKGSRKCFLLVIIPENWVCLYTFQLEPTHKGTMVMDQPIIDNVVKNISWYQWDPRLQWFCYARFSTMPTQTKRGGGKSMSDSSLVLHILSFSGEEHKTILTVALPIPHKHSHYSQTTDYYFSPLGFSLPSRELNMKVLHSHEGIWCVCLQHRDGRTLSTTRRPDSSQTEFKLEYSVYILHNGHVIDGEVILPRPPPTDTVGGHLIQFLLLGNFVVAYVPNVMLHILNIGVHVDPCRHVILNEDHSPLLPSNSNYEMERILTSALTDNRMASDISTSVFDGQYQTFYSCHLESRGLLEVFKKTTDLELKLSILHVTIVSLREYSVAVEMIENVCQSSYCMDTYRIFQEFIVALSYANIPPDTPSLVTRHIPLTTSLTYHGNIYKNSDGSKYVILRCTELPNFIKQLLVQSDQKYVSPTTDTLFDYSRTSTDAFGHLCFNAVLSQPHIYKRLSLEEISAQVKVMVQSTQSSPVHASATASRKGGTVMKKEKQSQTESGRSSFGRSSNFVGKLKDLINSPKLGHRQDLNRFGSLCLPFLHPDEDMQDSLKLRLNLLRDRLFQAMTITLGLRSKNSTSTMISKCGVYWIELQTSSRILLNIIWNSLKLSNENHPLGLSIHRQPSIDEGVLFELLESYYAAHDELGLSTPLGFDSLFIAMGYMCLEPSVFVQYLCNNVFSPTKRFLQLLFSDCKEVDETFLFEVIANLDAEMQEVALELWKHPHLVKMVTITNSSSSSGMGGSVMYK